MLTINEIRAALNSREHVPAAFVPAPSHASVAMILADNADQLEVCFIRRAERAGDPWSGQVAFPGGRAGTHDVDAHAVAERETFEEIGLHLSPAHRVGPLPIRPIERPGLRAHLTLSPFVYYVESRVRDQARVALPHEVASVFWVPLPHLFDHGAVTELEYQLAGSASMFPGIEFGPHVIWGLTLRVLQSFAEIVERELPAMS